MYLLLLLVPTSYDIIAYHELVLLTTCSFVEEGTKEPTDSLFSLLLRLRTSPSILHLPHLPPLYGTYLSRYDIGTSVHPSPPVGTALTSVSPCVSIAYRPLPCERVWYRGLFLLLLQQKFTFWESKKDVRCTTRSKSCCCSFDPSYCKYPITYSSQPRNSQKDIGRSNFRCR